jgi:indolepyruvate ferredoxin oxidoreductase
VSPLNLVAASPRRTVAIVSTGVPPTGVQVSRPGAELSDFGALMADINVTTRSRDNVQVDSLGSCRRLFATTAVSNTFLLGVAYQRGAIPVPAAFIEQAIEINGAAVELNRQAFRWGRMLILDPGRLEAAAASPAPAPAPAAETGRRLALPFAGKPELMRLVEWRAADLVAFQGERLAEDYAEFVVLASTAEDRAGADSTALSEAVARYLYKLMAYKDEYEVARLHLEESTRAEVEAAAAGRPVRVSWNLHPPMLRSLGLDRKIRLGPWAKPALRGLRAMRRVRGTAVDPFGYSAVRRMERQLIREYRANMQRAFETVTPGTYDLACELAALPDMVRGYEQIKVANVERYRAELARINTELKGQQRNGAA